MPLSLGYTPCVLSWTFSWEFSYVSHAFTRESRSISASLILSLWDQCVPWTPSFCSNPHYNAEVYFKTILRPSVILSLSWKLSDAFLEAGKEFLFHFAVRFPWHPRDSASFSRVSFQCSFLMFLRVSAAVFRVPGAFRLSTFILNLNLHINLKRLSVQSKIKL